MKTTGKFRRRFIWAALFVVPLCFACETPVSGPREGSVVLTLPEIAPPASSRTALADSVLAEIRYVVACTGPGDATTREAAAGETIAIGLVPGKWHITVDAYMDAMPAGHGEADVDIRAGLPVKARIDMELSAEFRTPSISSHPVGADYDFGDIAEALTVTAVNRQTGDETGLNYQWYSNDTNSTVDGSPIPGETGASYTPPVLVAGMTYYYVMVIGPNGGTVSTVAAVSVGLPPLTGTVSIAGAAVVGQTLTADTAALEGSGAVSWQWQRSSAATGPYTDIAAATGSSYTLTGDDNGHCIRVRVTRAGYGGSVASAPVSASMGPPVITVQPVEAVFDLNQPSENAPLNVTAVNPWTGDSAGLSYQWHGNATNSNAGGSPIPGETGASYAPPTNATGTIYYYVVVANPDGETVSNAAAVWVNLPSLTGTVSIAGTAAPGQTLTADTSGLGGSGAVSWQWQCSSIATGPYTNIAAATGSSYTLTGADSGHYIRVTVTRAGYGGSLASAPVNVPVGPPVINVQPAGAVFGLSQPSASANLSVTAVNPWTGDGASLSYQWHSNATNSNAGGSPIPGETGASYAPPTDTAGTIYYYVVVASPDDETVSNAAAVAVKTLADRVADANAAGGTHALRVYQDESFAGVSVANIDNAGITIEGDGVTRTVQLAGTGSIFRIGAGGSLVLGNNLELAGLALNTDALVYLEGGSLVMQGDSAITGNTASSGGGVYVDGGTFAMSGTAAISGNTATNGGGVYVNGGTFAMSGTAAISGNTATNGGGVYVGGSGTFTKTGGTIYGDTDTIFGNGYASDNTAVSGYGHAVYSTDAYWRNTTVTTADNLGYNGTSYSGAWHASLDDFGAGPVTIEKAFAVYGPTETDWQTALTAIAGGGDNKNYLIYVYGNVSGIAGVSASSFGTTATNIKVAIRGGGGLALGSGGSYNGSILRIGANQTVASRDVTLTGIDDVAGYNNASLIYIEDYGTLYINNGAVIRNNYFHVDGARGGGIYVGGNAALYISGGEISGNKTGITTYNASSYGGGVYVDASGTFVMDGGKISNNAATVDQSTSRGGGVYVAGGAGFTMNGGEISANYMDHNPNFTAPSAEGTGVHVASGGSFTMHAGEISGNVWGSRSGRGAGVWSAGTFVMDGGTIRNNLFGYNTGSAPGVSSFGGGVYVAGGSFTLSGNAGITGNTVDGGGAASTSGGGVYVESGTFNMSGAAVISGNTTTGLSGNGGGVYVNNGGTFTLKATGRIMADNTASSAGNVLYRLGSGTAEYGDGSAILPATDGFNDYTGTALTGHD